MTIDQNNVIRVSKVFPCPVEDVYAICASDDFFDFCGVDIDSGEYELKVGGTYSYTVDESDYVKGEFREIVPGSRLVFTWLTMGLDGPTGETLVTLTFESTAKGSKVELVHTGFTHRKTAKAHDEAWVEIFESIAEELAEQG